MNTKLRDARIDRRLTLATVARSVGIDAGRLSRIERGEQDATIKIARALYAFYDGVISYDDIINAGQRESAA